MCSSLGQEATSLTYLYHLESHLSELCSPLPSGRQDYPRVVARIANIFIFYKHIATHGIEQHTGETPATSHASDQSPAWEQHRPH